MACMAQEYHGDGDVNGLLRKIGKTSLIHVDEHKACYTRGEMEGSEVTRARGKMTNGDMG